jgi:hypothetical protein
MKIIDPNFLKSLEQSKGMKEIRRKKIAAIGAMLESALIRNPYGGINRELPLPRIFINNKIYGHNTDEALNKR